MSADPDVVIVGAGPTGLMLAFELALAGTAAVVLERAEQPNPQSRANGIQPRTAEVLDMRGLLDEISDPATRSLERTGHFAGLPVPLDYTPWNTRFPATLGVGQGRIERHLEDRLRAGGTPVERGQEVLGVTQDEHAVQVTTARRAWRARYLVACDGAHSAVRRLCDIPFPGQPATSRSTVVDLRLTGAVPAPDRHFSDYLRTNGSRWTLLHPITEDSYRMVFGDGGDETSRTRPVTDAEVAEALRATHGEEVTITAVLAGSRFSDATRQVEHYRHGRVLLAGDAAHIHAPIGGQGVNLGIQDAVNLGWKLAAQVRGEAGPDLLDSYHLERHPVAAQVLETTLAQRAVMNQHSAESAALRALLLELARLPEVNSHLSGMMSGLALRYPLPGPAHPLLGHRAPEVVLATDRGPVRLAEPLRAGRGLVLLLAEQLRPPPGGDHAPPIVHAEPDARLPARVVLVRPDGYIGWAGDDEDGLHDALRRWFGSRTPSSL